MLSLEELADLAVEHAGQAVAQPAPPANAQALGQVGRRRGARGRGGGQIRHPERRARRAAGRARGLGPGLVRRRLVLRQSKGMRQRHVQHRQANSRLQASAANSSGRSRTVDHLLPMHSTDKRPTSVGQGGWKVWTPEAILRAAFSQASASVRQIAKEIDGASASQTQHCRCFVARALLEKQESGLEQERAKARHLAFDVESPDSQPPQLWILNIMFDETELDLTLNQEGPGAWSILASHSQLSVSYKGKDFQEFDFIRVPQALPRKTASCMWAALNLGAGGLGPGNLCPQSSFQCVWLLVTRHPPT